jgi:hypothetical protein
MAAWEIYNPTCFVGREQDRNKCLQWIEHVQPKYRMYTFIGAAGTGKTWLLHALHDDLKRLANAPYQPEPIWLSFPAFAKKLAQNNQAYTDAISDWLLDLRGQIIARHPAIPTIASDVMVRRMVEVLAEQVCEQLVLRPVLLVEGYDEVDSRQAVQIARDLLYPFVGKHQTRIVMGRRDTKLRDVDELRWKEIQVTLEVDAILQTQLVHFQQQFFPDRPLALTNRIAEMQQLVPGYVWNHHYINAFLFNVALLRANDPNAILITVDDRYQCCWELIHRGGVRNGELDQKEFQYLKQIAHELERSWSETALQQALGLRLKNIDSLFVYGTIYRDRTTAQRFRIADGLYELLAGLPA